MKVLMVAPLQAEVDLLSRAWSRQGLSAGRGTIGRLPVMIFPDLNLSLACGGHGKAQFAVQTQHLIDHAPAVELVVCGGAAGALAADVSIGDIVVASSTLEHDYHLKFVTRPVPQFAGCPQALARLRQVCMPRSDFRVHYGVVASGDEDVMTVERGQALHERTGALVVAWEGAGGARASRFSQVPFVELRGVTDTTNHDAVADFRKNLGVAMNNLATLVAAWLQQT
jgi:adenosylhomocysteine nucleosidase